MDQINSHTFKDFSGGYNPKTGFFISRTVLDGDYYKDVDRIVEGWVNMYADPNLQHTVKGAGKFNVVSLKSYDGTNERMDSPPEPEVPDNFKYTPAYYSRPILKKAVVAFIGEKDPLRKNELKRFVQFANRDGTTKGEESLREWGVDKDTVLSWAEGL